MLYNLILGLIINSAYVLLNFKFIVIIITIVRSYILALTLCFADGCTVVTDATFDLMMEMLSQQGAQISNLTEMLSQQAAQISNLTASQDEKYGK